MLIAGTSLGPYRIVAPLGAGGMGEVYRAHDPRLGRDVAIKVLPARSLLSADARARFEREARTISQLSHPHICTLFDVGRKGETDFLVMELLEGETLAHRVARGALPVADVLKLGAEIASALDRAHAAGVVHRDLKPANVMLTKSGAKLMDFGLARVAATPGSASGAALSASPTQAQPSAPLTGEGAIVGTFEYMAPEQLEGREADMRSDIWALGCVLYEMATGKRAFGGASGASLIAAILKEEPRAMSELAPLSPPALEHVVTRCLAKDPNERWQSARDVMHALEMTRSASGASVTAPAVATRHPSSRFARGVATALALALIALASVWFTSHRERVGPLASFEIPVPPGLTLGVVPALSPDGRWLVFAAMDSTSTGRLWLRGIGSTALRPLPGTESSTLEHMPFWSPDSRQIAFFARGKLLRIPREGGDPVAICDVAAGRGGSWSPNGTILFGSVGQVPMMRVPAGGGTPVALSLTPITRNGGPRYPSFLPDGRHFVFSAISPVNQVGDPATVTTWWTSLDGGSARHVLDSESGAWFVAPHWLVFRRDSAVWVQRIDPGSGGVRGAPRALAASAVVDPLHPVGAPLFTADSNLLVIEAGRIARDRLYWYDREGRLQAPASLFMPRAIGLACAPDGDRALYYSNGQPLGTELHSVDLSNGLATSIGYQNYPGNGAGWSADGRMVYYQIAHENRNVLRTFAAGSNASPGGSMFEFARADSMLAVDDCTPDGSQILGEATGSAGHVELRIGALRSPITTRAFLSGPFDAAGALISADGKRVLFETNETGSSELYVCDFGSPEARVRISSDGVMFPRDAVWHAKWVRDGREITYLAPGGRVMAVDIAPGPGLHIGTPRLLFRLPAGTHALSCTRDGNRFLLALPGEPQPPQHFSVLVNWQNGESR